MPATAAQVEANRRNAQRSTGPKTAEGKERSRANAIKHGLTGDGVALSNEDSAEVEELFQDLEAELRPSGTVGRLLVRRIATLAVRMERSVLQESAALSERVEVAEGEALAQGLSEEEQAAAGRRAMFDPSRGACLARRYEAAAERGFYKALKEFHEVERQAEEERNSIDPETIHEQLASFRDATRPAPSPASPAPSMPPAAPTMPPAGAPDPSKKDSTPWNPPAPGSYDIPITIGRAG